MVVELAGAKFNLVNLTRKTLVFPDGTTVKPMVVPPDVVFERHQQAELLGAPVVAEGWTFKHPIQPWGDTNTIFVALRPVAEAYWRYHQADWVYGIEGEEKEGIMYVSHVLTYCR